MCTRSTFLAGPSFRSCNHNHSLFVCMIDDLVTLHQSKENYSLPKWQKMSKLLCHTKSSTSAESPHCEGKEFKSWKVHLPIDTPTYLSWNMLWFSTLTYHAVNQKNIGLNWSNRISWSIDFKRCLSQEISGEQSVRATFNNLILNLQFEDFQPTMDDFLRHSHFDIFVDLTSSIKNSDDISLQKS